MSAPDYTALNHFKRREFNPYADRMSQRLLAVYDLFRTYWGAPVGISPAPGALGRYLGRADLSQHNLDKWPDVRAADSFPAGMETGRDFERAYHCAKRAGATGIGIYTDTKPGPMIHLDVREDRVVGIPATWSRVSGNYGGLARIMPSGFKL